jgi:hypothetical protein
MRDELPKLASDDIEIDEPGLEATATFVFPDGVRFPIQISRHTLPNWTGQPDAWGIRMAVLRRSGTLAKLVQSARKEARKKMKI